VRALGRKIDIEQGLRTEVAHQAEGLAAQPAVLRDVDHYRHRLAMLGDDLRLTRRRRPEHLAEALLGFLNLPLHGGSSRSNV